MSVLNLSLSRHPDVLDVERLARDIINGNLAEFLVKCALMTLFLSFPRFCNHFIVGYVIDSPDNVLIFRFRLDMFGETFIDGCVNARINDWCRFDIYFIKSLYCFVDLYCNHGCIGYVLNHF